MHRRARTAAAVVLTIAGALAAAVAWLLLAARATPVAVVVPAWPGAALAAGAAAFAGGLTARLAATGRVRLRRAGLAVLLAGAAALPAVGLHRTGWGAVREVRFESGDVTLAGTLVLPRGAGPHPAAAIVHGSGPETRREYRFLARYLARHGIAALIWDKRGTGASSGRLYDSDYRDYARDARAAVRLLGADPAVDADAVGLIGFSEGEWVAPLAAAGGGVAFVVVVGASGLSPAGQVAEEIELRLRARGHGPDAIERARVLGEQVFAYQRTGEGAGTLRAALDAARDEAWFQDAEDLPTQVYRPDDYAWWRSVMDFDAAAAWRDVDAPVLLLKGAADDRSSAEAMPGRIAAALAAGGHAPPTVHVFPEADHTLLVWPRGRGSPPPAFAPGYLETLVDWIHARTAR